MSSNEIYRLAGRPPLKTLLLLSIGPLCSQITSVLYGIINTIWISKYVGEVGMSAVAIDVVWELTGRAFGLFISIAASTQISALFGRKQFEVCEQVACDLYRVALICGCIVPAILIPINKPFSRWFKASDAAIQQAYDYIIPQAAGNVLTCIFYTNIGFLQAEGRTLLVGIIDIVSLGCGMGILNPIFLGVLKTGIAGPSYSTIIADGVPGIILTILYFCGKFGVKPKLRGLIKPFSKNTLQGLLVGSSMLISQISISVPAIFLRRLMGASISNPNDYDVFMAGFNVVYRINMLTACVIMAFCTGFLAPAAYAYAAKLWKRYIMLSVHVNWICFAWSIITNLVTICMPVQCALLFGKGDYYVYWTKLELYAANWGTFLMFGRFTIQSMLQSQQNGKGAMAVSLLSNFVTLLASIYIIDYVHPHETEKLLWSFSLINVVGILVGVALLAYPFYKIIKAWKHPSLDDENKDLDDIKGENIKDEKRDSSSTNDQEEKKDSSTTPDLINSDDQDQAPIAEL